MICKHFKVVQINWDFYYFTYGEIKVVIQPVLQLVQHVNKYFVDTAQSVQQLANLCTAPSYRNMALKLMTEKQQCSSHWKQC